MNKQEAQNQTTLPYGAFNDLKSLWDSLGDNDKDDGVKIPMTLVLTLELFFTLLDKRVHKRKELAEKLEVSERTIVRYIDNLRDARILIESTSGQSGGYILSDYTYKRFCYYVNSRQHSLAHAEPQSQSTALS